MHARFHVPFLQCLSSLIKDYENYISHSLYLKLGFSELEHHTERS